MSTETKNGWVKPTLELGPVIIFLLAYLYWRNDEVVLFGNAYQGLVAATIVFIPVVVLATILMKILTGKVSPMQLLTAVLVVFLGGLTLWLNDPKFIQIKPTIIYFVFAAILVFGLWTNRLYLRYLLEDAIPMYMEGWVILTRRVIIFFAFLALLNEGAWRFLGQDVWVTFKTFGLPLLTLGFFALQWRLFSIYSTEEDF